MDPDTEAKLVWTQWHKSVKTALSHQVEHFAERGGDANHDRIAEARERSFYHLCAAGAVNKGIPWL